MGKLASANKERSDFTDECEPSAHRSSDTRAAYGEVPALVKKIKVRCGQWAPKVMWLTRFWRSIAKEQWPLCKAATASASPRRRAGEVSWGRSAVVDRWGEAGHAEELSQEDPGSRSPVRPPAAPETLTGQFVDSSWTLPARPPAAPAAPESLQISLRTGRRAKRRCAETVSPPPHPIHGFDTGLLPED